MQKSGETASGGVDGGGGSGRWCSAARSVVVREETPRQTSDLLFHLCQRQESRALEGRGKRRRKRLPRGTGTPLWRRRGEINNDESKEKQKKLS
jgi:hypothetical protein